MPGFPFAAIGAGIGQGTQQLYRQQQIQAALDQIKQQQQTEAFIGGLPGGTLPGSTPIPGMAAPFPNAGGGLPGATTTPSPAAAAPSSPAPSAPAAPTDPFNGDPGTPGRVTGVMPLEDDPASQVSADTMAPGGTATPPPAAPAAAPAAGAASDTAPHTEEVHAAASAVGVPPDHPFTFSDQQYNHIVESLFRQPLTFGDVLSRFQQARPDADPGTIGRAAMMTYKMVEQGDAAQNNMGFRVLSSLAALDRIKAQAGSLDERTRHDKATEDISTTRATTAAGQGQQKIDIAQGNLEARRAATKAAMDRAVMVQGKIDARALARQAQQQAALAQRAGNQAAAAQIRAITAQINAIHNKSPMGIASDEDQKVLENLEGQLADIGAQVGGTPVGGAKAAAGPGQ